MGTVTVRETTICPNYVNGQWVESRSGKKLLRPNPANLDDVLGFAPLSSRDEIREAVEAARRALPAWRDTLAPVRGKYVMQAARLMAEEKDELARLLTREEGKTVSESLGEIVRTVNILEYTAGEARRLTGETLPSELPRNFIYTIRPPPGSGSPPPRPRGAPGGAGGRRGWRRPPPPTSPTSSPAPGSPPARSTW